MHTVPAAYSMHFSFLLRTCCYFPSTALTESCFKSQHLCKSEPQSTRSWTCTLLLTTYRKAGWTISPSCTQEWDSLRGRIQLSTVSFNRINETATCIAFPNALLHGAHTFSIYSPARPVTSLLPQHAGVPPAPDEAVPSEITHDSVNQRLCKATNRNTAG